MQKDFILSHVDHTMLKQGATWADIQRICDEGLSHKTASVCIPPSYVADAAAFPVSVGSLCRLKPPATNFFFYQHNLTRQILPGPLSFRKRRKN